MRLVKAGAFAVVLAGVCMAGAGVAHADTTITVTADLMTCATNAGINTSELAQAKVGDQITVSEATDADLKAHNCL
ncbi:hypothetical protein CRH09_20725 [Nocardia terpenica]|uniref:Uncharacterized protein n=2 Tax=Nocardia terpenica TaxID=455432 RepID=A0A291RKZ0_9NOCA|nr:hypothetical protein CRH09_20725 [Nocardia terpenica]